MAAEDAVTVVMSERVTYEITLTHARLADILGVAIADVPALTHPVHGEPEVTEPHARMIVFTWDLGAVDEHGRTGTVIGELVVSHRLDAKAFTANLRTGVRVPHAGTSYRYQLGQPGWHMSQPIARYSRPRLLAYAARALAALREADPAEIAHVFVAVESWEQWVGSRTPPVQRATRGAKVTTRDGIRWISYRDERDGQQVIVEMPSNGLSKSCDEHRHDDCGHRLGGPHEGGVILKLSLPGFLWHCGCPCHNDPIRAGRLF